MSIQVIHEFASTSTTVLDLRDGDTVLWVQKASYNNNYADAYVLTIDGDAASVTLGNWDNFPIPSGEVWVTQLKILAQKIHITSNGEHDLEFTPTANMSNDSIIKAYILRGVLSVGEAGNSYLGVSTGEPQSWPWVCSVGDYTNAVQMYGININTGVPPTSGTSIYTELGITVVNTGLKTSPITFQSGSDLNGTVFLMLFGGVPSITVAATCVSVTYSVSPEMVISGTGVGLNATTWTVTDTFTDTVQASGVGNEASFSFPGLYGSYKLTFSNDIGAGFRLFSVLGTLKPEDDIPTDGSDGHGDGHNNSSTPPPGNTGAPGENPGGPPVYFCPVTVLETTIHNADAGTVYTVSHTSPADDEPTFLLVSISGVQASGSGAQYSTVDSVSYDGEGLIYYGRIASTAFRFVEMWGLINPTPGVADVIVTFPTRPAVGDPPVSPKSIEHCIIAVNTLRCVNPYTPVAGWISKTGTDHVFRLTYEASSNLQLFDMLAREGATPAFATTSKELYVNAVSGSGNPFRTIGGNQVSSLASEPGGSSGDLLYVNADATEQEYAFGALALVLNDLPSDLDKPPFISNPDPDNDGKIPIDDDNNDGDNDPNTGPEAYNDVASCVVSGNIFVQNTDIALRVEVFNRVVVTGNTFGYGAKQAIVFDYVDKSLISDNLFSGYQKSAIGIIAGWHNKISGNTIQDSALSGNSGDYGIDLVRCVLTTISDNRIVGITGTRPLYAIRVGSWCDQTAIVNNDFRYGFTPNYAAVGNTGYNSFIENNLPQDFFLKRVGDAVGQHIIVETDTILPTYEPIDVYLSLDVKPGTVDADTVDGKHATDLLDKATYDADNDGIVDEAESVPWDGIPDKPQTFPPSAHTHPWDDITDEPGTFPPSAHTHDYAASNHSHASGPATDADTLDTHHASYFSIDGHTHAGLLPTPTIDGQVLFAIGGAFVVATSLIGETGDWLSSDAGVLLVMG